MRETSRYPKIGIRSKNELAKRISGPGLAYSEALALINDVIKNHDRYWQDSKKSEPIKKKYVRSAVGTPLGYLLKRIDKKVLRPYDSLAPSFVFGGLSRRNHIQASYSLLGRQRGRILIGLDITRFFEQNLEERIFYLFHKKCDCRARAARLLAQLCCVPLGPKGSISSSRSLARGFAPSTRLALWSNLTTFMRVKWKVERRLHGHDPRIAVFVDDIGITASRVTEKVMHEIATEVKDMLLRFDPNQPLPLNDDKTKIRQFAKGAEHLGMKFGRNSLSIGSKARSKRDKIRNELQQSPLGTQKAKLIRKRRAYYQYERQIAEERIS